MPPQMAEEIDYLGAADGAAIEPVRTAAGLVPLRSFMRQRAVLVEELNARTQRMQKALTEMNLMLHTAVSDITGVTGRKIIAAILEGERDPERLALHRDARCHASQRELVAALTGNYRAEHLFALRQNYAAYQLRYLDPLQVTSRSYAWVRALAAEPFRCSLLPLRRSIGTKRDASGPALLESERASSLNLR
jgi:hypothetical protein